MVAAFDSGQICPEGGAPLVKRTDEGIGLLDRLARCFVDGRQAGSVEHSVRSMLAMWAERVAPQPHQLVAHFDSPFGEDVFDVAVA